MSKVERKFRLPGRVDSYLSTLSRVYERSGEPLLRELVVNGVVSIHEGAAYDNWNGGRDGHAITLAVTEDLFLRAIDAPSDLQSRIATDLNKLDNSQDEYVSEVYIEMVPTVDDGWREQSGVYRPHMAPASLPDEALHRIWGRHRVRVFLSHKSSIKVDASSLKQAFDRCGIAAFVAHEDIEPTQEWQREIERALFSMDALVALLTPDYHDSNWTDQEVGVAIGRGVPVLPIRLGRDPYGLMGKLQGHGKCSLADPSGIATNVFRLLHRRLPDRARLFDCAIAAYANSASWADSAWRVEHVLSVFENLTPADVERVVTTYRANDENKSSFRGMTCLKPLLEKWTGAKWHVVENELMPVETAVPKPGAEIPF